MTFQEKRDLIGYINQSTNSNAMILLFDKGNKKDFILKDFLVRQLRSGKFYYEMQKADISQGYEWYTEVVRHKGFGDMMTVLGKPGNTRNGNEDPSIQSISEKQALEVLLNIMTKERSRVGETIDETDMREALELFLGQERGGNKSFYTIEPNFLYSVNDMVESDYTLVGYFEDQGNNFVLAIETDECVTILLINGI